MPRHSLVHFAGVLTSVGLAACSSAGTRGSANSDTSNLDCFLAFSAQFQAFENWPSFHFESTVDAGPSHLAGQRTEYLNHQPPAGATEFETGTILVKVIDAIPSGPRQTFGMVKRGCGFNSSGARGWEWFELQPGDGAINILWRGVGPPAGEQYGGDSTGGCNSCHKGCADNDSVCSSNFRLPMGVDDVRNR